MVSLVLPDEQINKDEIKIQKAQKAKVQQRKILAQGLPLEGNRTVRQANQHVPVEGAQAEKGLR